MRFIEIKNFSDVVSSVVGAPVAAATTMLWLQGMSTMPELLGRAPLRGMFWSDSEFAMQRGNTTLRILGMETALKTCQEWQALKRSGAFNTPKFIKAPEALEQLR